MNKTNDSCDVTPYSVAEGHPTFRMNLLASIILIPAHRENQKIRVSQKNGSEAKKPDPTHW
jgi:hypothetical protein